MESLALLLIGFSVFSALLLVPTHFRAARYPDHPRSRRMGMLLMLALGGLQLAHFGYLQHDLPWVGGPLYRSLLFVVAPAFYLFSEPLLRTAEAPSASPWWHGLPVLAAPALPAAWAWPLAFLVGAGYLAWLARRLWGLRAERSRFRQEMALLGGVFAIAVAVATLGIAQGRLPDKSFFALYAMAIGAAFLLVQAALALRPELPDEVVEASEVSSYANSTLGNVDCARVLAQLEQAMTADRLYTDPALSLPALAEKLGLSAHQLSELVNTRLGKSFSRYLRERRVAAAREMLLAEPSASVLAVGLSVGFSAQSNFYDAFREIEGNTPGQYRKRALASQLPREDSQSRQ